MDIYNIANDKKLINKLNKYSFEKRIGDRLFSVIENSKNGEKIIPVLGMQGMGKSTLINAMLCENILPNEADETTCVPVEIKYGEEKILVHFNDSDKIQILNDKSKLCEYVDNAFNTGNKKGVSHIVIYKKSDILEHGITIVDLPGIGSLTKENQETTEKYIKTLCTAIFVIPTTPTIRKMEQIFIKAAWMNFNSAIFVQNNFGENKREVEESVEFNTMVLNKIADSINASFDDDIKVVNAYDALYASLHNDEKLRLESNINDLISTIKDTAINWDYKEFGNIVLLIRKSINLCLNEINTKFEEREMSLKELESKIEEEENNFKLNTIALEKEIDEINDYLEKKEDDVFDFAKKNAKEYTENLRTEIFRLIDKGIVDGEQLTEAFKHYQEQFLETIINNYYDLAKEILDEVSVYLERMDSIVSFEINIKNLNFYKEKSLKFEKGLKFGFDILGVLGAAFIAFGEKNLLLGVGIGIVSNIIGDIFKDNITRHRGRKTKQEINKLIYDIEDLIKQQIIDGFDAFSKEIRVILKEYLIDRNKELESIKEHNKEKLSNKYKNKYNYDELKNDYEYFKSKERELDELKFGAQVQYSK